MLENQKSNTVQKTQKETFLSTICKHEKNIQVRASNLGSPPSQAQSLGLDI